MKRINFIFLVLGAIGLMSVMASCSDEGAETIMQTALEKQFSADFPAAQNVVWSKVGDFDVAAFALPATRNVSGEGKNNEAWYSDDELIRHDIEFDVEDYDNQLPQAVATAFAASEYADTQKWELDEIEYEDNKNSDMASYFVFELEATANNGTYSEGTDIELYYDADGTLLATKLDVDNDTDEDDDRPVIIPEGLIDAIKTDYPTAIIIEVEEEEEDNEMTYEVELRVGDKDYDIVYNDSFRRIKAEYKVDFDELPIKVQDHLKEYHPTVDFSDDDVYEGEFKIRDGSPIYIVEVVDPPYTFGYEFSERDYQ